MQRIDSQDKTYVNEVFVDEMTNEMPFIFNQLGRIFFSSWNDSKIVSENCKF